MRSYNGDDTAKRRVVMDWFFVGSSTPVTSAESCATRVGTHDCAGAFARRYRIVR